MFPEGKEIRVYLPVILVQTRERGLTLKKVGLKIILVLVNIYIFYFCLCKFFFIFSSI